MKKAIILLGLIAFLAVSCEKNEQEFPVLDVSFTPCQQNKPSRQNMLTSNVPSDKKVDVKFTNNGVQIAYYDFEVTCDFTTINVTHTFKNGFLNITQQGAPNQADCRCYTDVSYTINGISQNEVNVIFINGEQVYCYNDKDNDDCIDLKIGEETEIKSGETACNAQYGLSLRVENVNDSRCPMYATCVWAGTASVQFHLTTANGEYNFVLDTYLGGSFKNDTIIEGIKYELIDVLPYPVFGGEQSIKTVKILLTPNSQSIDWTNKTAELRIHNQNKISITEGIWGTLVKTEGNCMPVIDFRFCKQYPVKREIVIYEYTKMGETRHEFTKFFEIYTNLIATITCDEEGFFELALEPGKYSVFVREGEYLYANLFDGQGGIVPVTVEVSKLAEVNLNLDYASH